MTTLFKVGERVYKVLFPDLMRPLSKREYQDLKNSIRKRGIESAVIVDCEDGIIDGANRARIACELGFPILHVRIVEIDDLEAKRQLALSLNLDRRHLSPVEREAAIKQRRTLQLELKRQGKTTREIAEEVGVDQSTVVRDLQASDASDADASDAPDASEEREGRRALATKLKRQGKTTREIAEEVGVDHSTVVRDLQASGASDASGADAPDAPDASEEREGRRALATKLKRQGKTTREIAEEVGVDQSTVVRDLQASGASDASGADAPDAPAPTKGDELLAEPIPSIALSAGELKMKENLVSAWDKATDQIRREFLWEKLQYVWEPDR